MTVMSPDSNAAVEAAREGSRPSISTACMLPEQNLSSESHNCDDSDSDYSSFSATQALINASNTSDSASSSVSAKTSKAGPLHLNARDPKKTLGKRLRTDSNASSSNGAAIVPAKKRIRNNALMRSAPRAVSTTTPGGLAGNSDFMNFTATIFIIQLGPDGPQFHAHESVLKRSPKLVEEIEKAKGNKRAAKQNILSLMPHDAVAFEQMLQFLYKDKFLMSKNKNAPTERLGEFKELMSLAKHYVLPGLQKQVVKLFSSSKVISKIALGQFFDWAEDMYYEELDHANGPFKLYLSRIAPTLVKGADEATMKDLVRMVKQGGGFAEQLFIAAIDALNMEVHRTAVKKEEPGEGPTAILPRTIRGKDKEPIALATRDKSPNTHENEFMEDNESLFVPGEA